MIRKKLRDERLSKASSLGLGFEKLVLILYTEIWRKTISGGEGCWRGKWGGLFWVTSLEKIFGGVIAIISYRPGGWMQQSAVPRCAILSVGSTGGIGQ
jgi:hypothetical protein